jgi:HAD superfamily hydrolase (TIGR01509 family)
MLKAIIFDIDGVLLDSFEANLKFYQDLMIKAGYRPPTREEFPAIFHFSMMDAIKSLTKSDSEEEIKRIWELGRSREVGYGLDLLTTPEGIEEVLEQLNKDYKLGIVTSRVRESVYEFPKLAKLEKYFKVAVSYQDTTKHKPDPEPLLLAAHKLGVKPEECVYIGDVENDITAARSAGMKVVIYSQNQFNKADASTPLFTELPQMISYLAQKDIDDVIWVDEDDNELGVIPREKAHREGLLHRIAVIYLTRKDGQILIQERISGRLDHSSAGHVDPGESYLQAAQRELEEELGIKDDLVKLGKTVSDEIDPESDGKRIRHIFEIFECQAEPGHLAEGEVKGVFWADPKTIYEEMKGDIGNNKYCGGFKVSLKFFLEQKEQM